MSYNINSSHDVAAQEFSVDWNGFNFLIIYGKHKNGWFAAIPNWNVCTEMGNPKDEYYNTTKLAQTNIYDSAPIFLAKAIKEHWEGISNGERNN